MTGNQGNPNTPYPSLAIWYGGKMVEVEIIDRYESGGIKCAVVKSTQGKEFVGGDKYPIRTDIICVPLNDIVEIRPYQETGEK